MCNFFGCEIFSIFLVDVYYKVKVGFFFNDCDFFDIILLRIILLEGYSCVINLKIYVLFVVSDIEVLERYMVFYVVWYNDNCVCKFFCFICNW